ncbi:MAG: T9SS type A sorting domain-containing protein [Ferruginibacter sp.]
MQELSTFKKKGSLILVAFFVSVLSLLTTNASAQEFCANETVLWSENFGTGTGSVSSTDVINVLHSPVAPNVGLNDGYYRIINNTQQRNDWHNSPDHTPSDVDGRALVVNGIAETFYTKEITNGVTGFNPATYGISFFLMNVNTNNYPCSPYLLPTISFVVEYSTAASGNSWVTLQSVSTTPLPITNAPVWVQLGGSFNLPVAAQRFRFTLSDGTSYGCGNDFAIDDIKFVSCPEGGPMPVEFLSLAAVQKGSGVSVNWSTASELNNNYFDVERSTDGTTWNTIARVMGAGNSATVKNYNAYDAKPVAGYNLYRIRQVDIDGKFEYSSTVKVKITIDKLGVSVLANPFVNNITVDFLSNNIQTVSARLTDLSGKTVAMQNWSISTGTTRKTMDNVVTLQRGMYILTITDMNGAVVFNSKLIKQ